MSSRSYNRPVVILTLASKEHGFTMVFDRFGTGLLFADQTVDITDGVVTRFDAVYAGN